MLARVAAFLRRRSADNCVLFRRSPAAQPAEPPPVSQHAVPAPHAQHTFGDFLLDHMSDQPAFGLDLASAAIPRIGTAEYPHGDDLLRYILRIASSAATGDVLLKRAMDIFDDADARFGRFASNLLAEWDRP